jgi:hypothetical protein
MRRITFLRGSLILPIVAPITALVLSLFGISGAFTEFLTFVSFFGAIPYAITAGILLFVSYKVEIERFLYWWGFSPFLMAAVVGPVMIVVVSVKGTIWSAGATTAITHLAASWGILLLYCLLVGYGYIAVAYLFYLFLKSLHLIKAEPRPLDEILGVSEHDKPTVA